MRKLSGSNNTSAVWSHFKVHTSKEKTYADKAWCDYCHKPFAREDSTLFTYREIGGQKDSQRKNLVNLGQDLGILEQDLMYLGHDTRFLTKVTKILTKIF